MSTNLTIQDRVFGLEREFNEVNSYKMNFIKEAQFALQLLEKNPSLLKAAQDNPASLEYALINVAAIGLSLNPTLNEVYLVPRGGKVCLDPSYRGLVKVATDSGSIKWVQAEIVKEKDKFTFNGVGIAPTHEMDPFSERGKTKGVYCVAKTIDDESLATMMSHAECMGIKDKYSKSSQAWKDSEEEMIKKTVIKRASKLWPKSLRLETAVSISNESEVDFAPRPHMDAGPVTPPSELDFFELRKLLDKYGKTEEGLLGFINAQSGLTDDNKLTRIEDFNSAQLESAKRILGGGK